MSPITIIFVLIVRILLVTRNTMMKAHIVNNDSPSSSSSNLPYFHATINPYKLQDVKSSPDMVFLTKSQKLAECILFQDGE